MNAFPFRNLSSPARPLAPTPTYRNRVRERLGGTGYGCLVYRSGSTSPVRWRLAASWPRYHTLRCRREMACRHCALFLPSPSPARFLPSPSPARCLHSPSRERDHPLLNLGRCCCWWWGAEGGPFLPALPHHLAASCVQPKTMAQQHHRPWRKSLGPCTKPKPPMASKV